jgi:hypothetical protein
MMLTPSDGAMAMAEMQVDLPYLSEEPDRHGNQRLYVRRNGRRIRLRVARGTDGFLDAYRAALDSLRELMPPSPTPAKKIAPRGSLGWLASLYFGSEEFKKLASGPTRRAVIEECLRETVRDGSDDLIGRLPTLVRDERPRSSASAISRRAYPALAITAANIFPPCSAGRSRKAT